METPIGDDDDSHLGDFIEDQGTMAPVEAAVYTSLGDATKEVLDHPPSGMPAKRGKAEKNPAHRNRCLGLRRPSTVSRRQGGGHQAAFLRLPDRLVHVSVSRKLRSRSERDG